MAQPNDYFLDEDQLRTLFEEVVRPFVLDGYSPQAQPVLSFFGAQQGAGRSQAIAARRQEPDGGDLVALSPDDLRPLHPRYAEVLAAYPLLMKDATAQATTAWVAMCHDHARRHGYGLLLEGTFEDPQGLLDVAAAYAADGYEVEMTALAVRLERSSLDTLNRHLPAHDAAPGRWVYPDRAQNAYRMIPLAVTAAEAAPQIHRIKVTNRAGEDLYTNVRTPDGPWQHEPAGAAAIEAERARSLPPAEAAEWLRLCQRVALNFTAADHLDDTTLDALNRVLGDAHRVGPIAGWTDSDRSRHSAVEEVVAAMAITSPWDLATSSSVLAAFRQLEQTSDSVTVEPLRRIEDRAAARLHPAVDRLPAAVSQPDRPAATGAVDPAEVERQRLPEAENQRIFRERIVPDLLAGREPQANPAVVFVIGQPGAGKSRVTEDVARALNRHGGFVDVDSDLYKPYHPAYEALMAQDDTLMAAYTRADGRAWMAQAEEYVRTHRLHAIIQETSQNTAAVEDKMLAYRNAGARVEALFMQVSQAMSNQGIVNRYFEQLADRGQGRLTVQANADESYRGILDLADKLDDSAVVHLANIYRRGESKPRYSNSNSTLGSGDWAGPPTLRDALEAERSRPWTAAESEAFVATQMRLRERSHGLGPEWPKRLAMIEQQAAPLLTPAAARQLSPSRPSTAAGRSRSTTGCRRSPESPGAAPVSPPSSAPHRGPGGPPRTHGRGRQILHS
ncbi:zeta toxin family protein [Streptomyces sp. NPDC090077]|uniref:zeta toxin family protein n=1 Tax=Streptomyces sp. NPDC090077 TaxID=3365938 RepID=UPI0038266E08